MRKKTTTILALELIRDDLTKLYFQAQSIESDLELDNSLSRCLSMGEDQAIKNLKVLKGKK